MAFSHSSNGGGSRGGGGESPNPINGTEQITSPDTGQGLGGELIKNTVINGQQFSIDWDNLLSTLQNTVKNSTGGSVAQTNNANAAAPFWAVVNRAGSAAGAAAAWFVNTYGAGTPGSFWGPSTSGTSLSVTNNFTTLEKQTSVNCWEDVAGISATDTNSTRTLAVEPDAFRLYNLDDLSGNGNNEMVVWDNTNSKLGYAPVPGGGGGGGFYQTMQEDGTDFPQRAKLNFANNGNVTFSLTDNAGSTDVEGSVTIPDGAFSELSSPVSTGGTVISTGLSFPVAANKKYSFRAILEYQILTNGGAITPAYTLTGAGNNVFIEYRVTYNGTNGNKVVAGKNRAFSGGVNAAALATNYPAIVEGHVIAAATGVFTLTFSYTGTGTVTLAVGSALFWKEF